MKKILTLLLISLLVLTSCDIELSQGPLFAELEAENAAGFEAGFVGGNGSAERPYIITNAEEFMKIGTFVDAMYNGDYLYFRVVNDIDLSSAREIGFDYFRGEIDFTGHTLTGLSMDRMADGHSHIIYDMIEGKISNLVYNPGGGIGFVYLVANRQAAVRLSTRPEVKTVFENVTVMGDYIDQGNNFSLYVSHVFAGALEFINCTNKAHVTTDFYAGAFLGGYTYEGYTTRLVYDGCTFEGRLVAREAGFCTGNGHRLMTDAADNVTVTNCAITGEIIGLENAGIFVGDISDTYETVLTKLNNSLATEVEGSVSRMKTLRNAFTAEYKDGTFTITDAPEGSVTAAIDAYIFTRMSPVQPLKSHGTKLVRFRNEANIVDGGAKINMPVRQVVDYIYSQNEGGVPSVDENGNSITTINGTEYYLVEEQHPLADTSIKCLILNSTFTEHAKGNLTYTLFFYDADGNPIGYKQFTVNELK